jgi:hypothetical protein
MRFGPPFSFPVCLAGKAWAGRGDYIDILPAQTCKILVVMKARRYRGDR